MQRWKLVIYHRAEKKSTKLRHKQACSMELKKYVNPRHGEPIHLCCAIKAHQSPGKEKQKENSYCKGDDKRS